MITINKADFLNGIRAVKSSCGKANLQPILNALHLKTIGQSLQITGTDIEKSARTVIEANVTEQQEFCVNADKLDNIVNALDDIITIEFKGTTALIQSGKTKFKVLILEASEFPNVEFNLDTEKIVLPKQEFVDGVNKTIISTSQVHNQILNGVCFSFKANEGYELAATDGNRLSQIKFDNSDISKDGQFVIPSSTLLNVIKNIGNEVEIYLHTNKIVIKTNNYLYQTNLLNGQYPPYQQLIPKNQPLKAIVAKADLLKSLEKVAIMCDERTNIAVFNFKNGELYLTSSCSSGKVEDVISVDFNEEIKIAFNFRYILEALKVMQTENVEFMMREPISACLINGDFIYLCMPIQVKE